MPYYRITYKDSTGKLHSGIRSWHIKNIEDAFTHFLGKARERVPDLQEFNCVMISTQSDEFQEYARKKRLSPPPGGYRRSGQGKYRGGKNEGPELGERNFTNT